MRRSTILRILLSCAALIALSCCTYGFYDSHADALHIPNISAILFRDSDISTKDRGTLVGSIGTNTLPGWRDYRIDVRSTDKKVRGMVEFQPHTSVPLDWNEPDWKGGVFSVALPPGEYEFCAMHVGNKQVGRVLNTEISLPFQVKSEESVYVGELKWSQTKREVVGLFGSKGFIPDPASFAISDRAARDVTIIQERHPELVARPLRIEIPVAHGSGDQVPAPASWR